MMTIRLKRFFAVLAAVSSLLITALLTQEISFPQETWPLPALYLFEMAAHPLIGAVLVLRDNSIASLAMWAFVGAIAGFVGLGAMSIGFAYIPVLILLGLSAALGTKGRVSAVFASLAVTLVAAAAQVAIMFALVRGVRVRSWPM